MVKGLFKSIFYTTNTIPYSVFPLPYLLLPEPLQGQYQQYYQLGTGSVVLKMLLLLVCFELIWGDAFQRALARTFFIVSGFWLVLPAAAYAFSFTILPGNIYFLPIIKIPLIVLYLVLGGMVSILFISFRNRLKITVNSWVFMLFNMMALILFLSLFLPLISGEIWVN